MRGPKDKLNTIWLSREYRFFSFYTSGTEQPGLCRSSGTDDTSTTRFYSPDSAKSTNQQYTQDNKTNQIKP